MNRSAVRPTTPSVRRARLAGFLAGALALTACATPPALAPSAGLSAEARAESSGQLDSFLLESFKAADADRNGRLDSSETGLTGAQLKALDRDGDQAVSRTEWERPAALGDLRGLLKAYQPMVETVYTQLDANANHTVTQQEVSALMAGAPSRAGLAPWEITMAWTLADENADGSLSRREFETFYVSLGADPQQPRGLFSRIGRGLLGAYLALASHIAVKQALHPKRTVPQETPKDVGFAYEDVTLRSLDGTSIAGWYVPNRAAGPQAVVMVHGHGDSRQMFIRQKTLKLLAARYTVLAIDLRNHGKSGGEATTFGAREGEDVAAAVAELKRRGHSQVALYGVSLGAASAIRAAAKDPSVVGVVDDCAYATVQGAFTGFIARLHVPGAALVGAATLAQANAELFLDLTGAQPVGQMPALAPRPVLVIHGEKDPAVPVSQSRLNFEAAGKNPGKALWIVPGAGHASSATDAPDEYATRVLGFLAAAFKR